MQSGILNPDFKISLRNFLAWRISPEKLLLFLNLDFLKKNNEPLFKFHMKEGLLPIYRGMPRLPGFVEEIAVFRGQSNQSLILGFVHSSQTHTAKICFNFGISG
jgi:hypothetical protein